MAFVRSLNTSRSTAILIAAVLAVGTGLLAFNYLVAVKKPANVSMRAVVIAAQAIPARTMLVPSMLALANRPADSAEPDAVANANDVAGQIALVSIPAGATISTSIVGRVALGGLSQRIPWGERGISIALDRVKGVADLIEPGDHVDVIAVGQSRGAGSAPQSSTILTNAAVLAMGSALTANTGPSPAPDPNFGTATLAVTPQEARMLALADLNADLRLSLRRTADNHTDERAVPFTMAATPGVVAAAAAVAPAAVAPTAGAQASVPPTAARPTTSPKPARTGPAIIDGDHFVNQ
jgi:pilus assembly protein CpaB